MRKKWFETDANTTTSVVNLQQHSWFRYKFNDWDWILIQEPLTRPGVKLDEKMSISSPTPRRYCESEKMSRYAVLKNLYESKMDVILTISFKITEEIEITKHVNSSVNAAWSSWRRKFHGKGIKFNTFPKVLSSASVV